MLLHVSITSCFCIATVFNCDKYYAVGWLAEDSTTDSKMIYVCKSDLWTICNRRRFWHATLILRSAIRRHHPPQRAVVGEHKVVLFQILLDGAEPRDVGTTWLSSPVRWRGDWQDPLGIYYVVCAHNMSRQGMSVQLDYSSEFGLLGLPLYIIVADKLVPFNAKQHTQTPLVECIDPTCIRLWYRPAVRTIQEYW